jgi:GntR family transcriptional regulator / MocR family aminotransferase
VRLGWLVVPEHLVATYRDAKYTADLARGVLDQATFAELLASGEMDRHIRRMAVEYRHRRDHLVAAVAASLPDWDVTGTAAGLHLVLHTPGGDDEALARQAQACGLDTRALSRYSLQSPPRPGLVIGYGHQPPATLTAAVEALARALGQQR